MFLNPWFLWVSQAACKNDKNLRALEIFSLLSLPKSQDVAVAIAAKFNLAPLLDRMHVLLEVLFPSSSIFAIVFLPLILSRYLNRPSEGKRSKQSCLTCPRSPRRGSTALFLQRLSPQLLLFPLFPKGHTKPRQQRRTSKSPFPCPSHAQTHSKPLFFLFLLFLQSLPCGLI